MSSTILHMFETIAKETIFSGSQMIFYIAKTKVLHGYIPYKPFFAAFEVFRLRKLYSYQFL
ncbi:hypothetical protein A262_26097 [Pseudomonas syringae pv. actinidiae ICMP 19073]|nr:hypothetical protein A262_26097 [Pseudomonas syringae pv. actinidiae ICMP 19073]